jgi:hypothetical protein
MYYDLISAIFHTEVSHILTATDCCQVSQLKLSRLSQYCSYSMFSNESTESLDSGPGSPATSLHRRLSQERGKYDDHMYVIFV